MRMYDIIEKKKSGGSLTKEEINFFINGYVSGEIPDYQVSALLMAICFQGMTNEETANLTIAMVNSGETADLSSIPGIKVDKHSTGGVGDKTTLIVSPIVASLGVRVAKMSGRGLGYTGGTVDKLTSIPGFQTFIGKERFLQIVRDVGVSLIGHSENLVPADKKLYALRDVTATVDSIPLIASSIMSKKIAAGSDCILLDVKTGSGAFMKTSDDAVKLAKTMVAIGESAGRKTVALITDMNQPLGNAIGNSLEVAEACRTLKGEGGAELTDLCVELAGNMLFLADKGNLEECRAAARQSIANGSAFCKLKEMVAAQGGNTDVLDDPAKFPQAKCSREISSNKDGFIFSIDTEKCGIASVMLGAGRNKKEDSIDYSAGIILHKKLGNTVKAGESVATLYASSAKQCGEAEKLLKQAIQIQKQPPKPVKLIYARIQK